MKYALLFIFVVIGIGCKAQNKYSDTLEAVRLYDSLSKYDALISCIDPVEDFATWQKYYLLDAEYFFKWHTAFEKINPRLPRIRTQADVKEYLKTKCIIIKK